MCFEEIIKKLATSQLNVSFKGLHKAIDTVNVSMKNSSVLLGISFSNKYPQDLKLLRMIYEIYRTFYKQLKLPELNPNNTTLPKNNMAPKKSNPLTIMLADTLYWHNLGVEDDSEEKILKQKATRLGNDFLEKDLIKSFLDGMNKFGYPINILRWNKITNYHNFEEHMKFINELYSENEKFKISVNNTAGIKVANFRKRISTSKFNQKKTQRCSRNFVLEEMAGEFVLADMGFDFEIYPGERNEAACFIHNNFISKTENYKNKLRWIMPIIRKRKKQSTKNPNMFFEQKNKKNDCTENKIKKHTVEVRKEDLITLMMLAVSKKIDQMDGDDSILRFTQKFTNMLKESDKKGTEKQNLSFKQ